MESSKQDFDQMKLIMLILVLSSTTTGIFGAESILFAAAAKSPAASAVSPPPQSESQAANSLSQRLYDRANQVFDTATKNHYEHLHEEANEQVRFAQSGQCEATTDCSGFVSFLLDSVAPKHYAKVLETTRKSHPVARSYANFFTALPPDQPDGGWMRLSSYKELRRGDIVAWAKRSDPDATTTAKKKPGHVMVVMDTPSQIEDVNAEGQSYRCLRLHVLDSSSVSHFPPEEFPPRSGQTSRDGVGKGYVRLLLDSSDNVIGYWEGSYSAEHDKEIKKPTVSDLIGMARVLPASQSR